MCLLSFRYASYLRLFSKVLGLSRATRAHGTPMSTIPASVELLDNRSYCSTGLSRNRTEMVGDGDLSSSQPVNGSCMGTPDLVDSYQMKGSDSIESAKASQVSASDLVEAIHPSQVSASDSVEAIHPSQVSASDSVETIHPSQ